MQTPEFLAWAIEFRCPLRGDLDGSDPELVERQLRSARAVGDAEHEGRVLDGLCVSPPDGFHISDALGIYGGELAVRQTCSECPANALISGFGGGLAGCYGLLPLPHDTTVFHAAVDRSLGRWSDSYPVTTPRWYGMWLDSPLDAEWLFLAFRVLDIEELAGREQQELLAALNTAYNMGARLHVRLYPPGRVEGPWWRLEPHCPRCKSRWADEKANSCRVCGQIGQPVSEKKRRARGRRPYFPLERLLGAAEAAEFLLRYEAQRARRESPDRV